MSNYLFYPHSNNTLEQLAYSICPPQLDAMSFIARLIAINPSVHHAQSIIRPNQLLLIPGINAETLNLSKIACCTPKQHQTLIAIAHFVGGAGAMAMAEFLADARFSQALSELKNYGGRGLNHSNKASNAILVALNDYDCCLEHFQRLRENNVTGQMLLSAFKRLQNAFEIFNRLVNTKSQSAISRYRSATVNFKFSSKTNAGVFIPVFNNSDIEKLVSLVKSCHWLSPGLINIIGPGFVQADDNAISNLPMLKQSLANNTGAIAQNSSPALLAALTSSGLMLSLVQSGNFSVRLKHCQDYVGQF